MFSLRCNSCKAARIILKKTDLAHCLASILHKQTIILISNLNVTLKLEKIYEFSLNKFLSILEKINQFSL